MTRTTEDLGVSRVEGITRINESFKRRTSFERG